MAASIPDRSLSEKVQIRLKRHGARNLFHVLFMRAVSAVVPFKILRGVYVNEPAASYLACSETYTAGLFTAQEMRRFAADPANEMPEAFIDSAAQKSDECYALIDGDNLAAYGWYARGPTSAGSPRLLLHFSDAYVYMYKGFTGNRYRGKRLHAIIKASAPALSPKLWYGMPAYAKDGKVVCFFQSAQKFNSRYATFSFSDKANLDEGAMWPTSFALKELSGAEEARIGALVKKAVS